MRRPRIRSRRSALPARPSARAPLRSWPCWARGLAVFGSYAKVLLVANAQGEERAAAYAQFGPLSAYPRALRLRELYPRLPQSPLPAVITCVAVTAGRSGSRSRADAGRVDLRRPGRARLRGRGGLSGDRPGSGRHLRRDPCVLGAGGLLRRRRRRSLPGGPARALTPATRRDPPPDDLPRPHRVPVARAESGLDRDGWVKADQLSTVPAGLLRGPIGRLAPGAIERLDAALRFVLDL